ncbi:hypothetical protein [Clostridium sp. BJN0013]|uniref:hypothetical protein n=1 Tax=Clostridium sp. BJN0013 TaxID=3236840 RepID=UPI0034C5DBB3
MSKKGVIAVIIIFTIIIFAGFTIVTARLPEFIKDDSNFKIDCSLSPFDFRVDMGEYSLYINNKIGYNFKNGTKKLVNSIGEGVHSGISKVTNKTEHIFENIEDKFTK